MNEGSSRGEGAMREERETGLKPARFSVRIDKDALAGVVPPEHVGDERVDEVRAFFERLQKLPEALEFLPGITLIVGENGVGKSMLARGLFAAAKYQEDIRFSLRWGRSDEGAISFADRGLSKGSSDPVKRQVAGLGPLVAIAMRESVLDTAILPEYIDVGSVYGELSARNKQSAFGVSSFETIKLPDGKIVDRPIFEKGSPQDAKSTRQSVDEYFNAFQEHYGEEMKSGRLRDRDVTGALVFVDEPETGLSPRRHHQIEEEIHSVFEIGKDSAVIVPTNSVVLFDSNLPRIDLAFPERGVHRPSEYPDKN